MKDQRLLQIARRISPIVLQSAGNDDENPAQSLAPGPDEDAANLGTDGPGRPREPLQRHRQQTERRCTDDGTHHVWSGHVPGWGRPDEDQVRDCDDGSEDLDEEDKAFGSVDDGGDDRGGHQADHDQEGTRDPAFGFREAIRGEDLCEERRERVEEAHEDGERPEYLPEGRLPEKNPDLLPDRREGMIRGWRDRGGGLGRDEEGGNGGHGRYDRNVENHIRNVRRNVHEQWADQLAKSPSERVGEARDRGSSDPAAR